MSDLQAVADRYQIEALPSEFTGTMICDSGSVGSLFSHDGAVRIPTSTPSSPARRRSALVSSGSSTPTRSATSTPLASSGPIQQGRAFANTPAENPPSAKAS